MTRFKLSHRRIVIGAHAKLWCNAVPFCVFCRKTESAGAVDIGPNRSDTRTAWSPGTTGSRARARANSRRRCTRGRTPRRQSLRAKSCRPACWFWRKPVLRCAARSGICSITGGRTPARRRRLLIFSVSVARGHSGGQ